MSGQSNDVFPFFVSCGRSGSTLIRSMFDSHPEIAIPGESYFISKLLPRRKIYEADGFNTARFLDDVVGLSWTKRDDVPTWIEAWGMDPEALRQNVLEAHPRTYPDAIRAVYQSYANWQGKRLYGDKTPAYIKDMGQIAKLLPEARFVHLVRDGRNVALAFLDAPFGPWTIEEIALHWRSRVLAGRETGARLGPSRYMEVRYEDLVERPEENLAKICDWIGVSFSIEMLDHRASARNISHQFEHAHQSVLQPVKKGVRDWRSKMDRATLGRFELIAGGVLDDFGYERSEMNPGPGKRLISASRRTYLEGKKVYRRMRKLDSAQWW